MKDKYYTPEIEEFHVGFEFEMLCVNSGEWIKKTIKGYKEISRVELLPNKCRVKYLDKEDIESLGFKQITDNCFSLPLKYLRGRLDEELRIVHTGLTLIYLAQGINDKDTRTLFTGNIKNKSELKKLLKQLGI